MSEQEADTEVEAEVEEEEEEEVVHEPPRKRRPPIQPPEETVVPVVAKDFETDIVDSETPDGWGQGLETPAPSPPEPAAPTPQPLVAPSEVPAPTEPTPAEEPKDSVPAAPPTVPGQPDVQRQDSQGTLLCTS